MFQTYIQNEFINFHDPFTLHLLEVKSLLMCLTFRIMSMINTSKTNDMTVILSCIMWLMLCWHVNRFKKEAAKDQHVSLITVNILA